MVKQEMPGMQAARSEAEPQRGQTRKEPYLSMEGARSTLDPWYLDNLVCPVDRLPLALRGDELVSSAGRRYPVVDGMPVMLVDDTEQTHDAGSHSLVRARRNTNGSRADQLFVDALGLEDHHQQQLQALIDQGSTVDPVVAFMVSATSGYAYEHLIGNLTEYPIPDLRLPDAAGARLLDIGCNWGRWSIAAARKGYAVTGIDPSLGGVMAARRVAAELGLPNRYVVGDARYLPFRNESHEVVFSYSVLQHLSKPNVRAVLSEVQRVLQPGGSSLIQMSHALGVRSIYHQARRRFREASGFEVRYWTIPELEQMFEQTVGPTSISVDCYFGLGLQKNDRHLMPRAIRFVIDMSEALRATSRRISILRYGADSLYVESMKRPTSGVSRRAAAQRGQINGHE